MSQIGTVEINHSVSDIQYDGDVQVKALTIGVAQRGPIYKPVLIDDIEKFLIIFGQPTNSYEFNFFQSVRSIVESGGVANCYRIPYTDKKDLHSGKMEFYIANISEQYDVALEDIAVAGKKYYLRSGNKKKWTSNSYALFLVETTDDAKPYIVIGDSTENGEHKVYRVYVKRGKLYADEIIVNETDDDETRIQKLKDIENAYSKFYVKDKEKVTSNEYDYCIVIHSKTDIDLEYKFGMYLEKDKLEGTDKTTMDVIYKHFEYFEPKYIAKLTFTLINDFDSILKYHAPERKGQLPYWMIDDICKTGLKEDIDPSQVLGIFPIIFGPKDAQNLRDINYKDIYPFEKDITDEGNQNIIDMFHMYTCERDEETNKPILPYVANTYDVINKPFIEFERSTHFRTDWLQYEIAKLVDTYVPQDTYVNSNTLGVAFFAIYLDDEHKLDYKLLESYYGLVGMSSKTYANLEDLINRTSTLFHLHIDGSVDNSIYLRALCKLGFRNSTGRWLVPFYAPKKNYYTYTVQNNATGADEMVELRHIVDMDSIFAETPLVKYNPFLSYSISRFFYRLMRMEYLNSAPFDYIVAPGMGDIIMANKVHTDDYQEKSVESMESLLVKYDRYRVNLDSACEYASIKNDRFNNIRNLYKLLGVGTTFGDKGTIAIGDIPLAFNQYLKGAIHKYDNEQTVNGILNDADNGIQNIIPFNKFSKREYYERMYPMFNYQYVDKHPLLTRYHRFRPHRKFELVPGSSVCVGAYVFADAIRIFNPIAGTYSYRYFDSCHKCFIEMINPLLFKLLFDTYGITSFLNNNDNGTYPIQQTTWSNSLSVLKQLHAFRIYVAIRRTVYALCHSYLYEPNTTFNRERLKEKIHYVLNQFVGKGYIQSHSFAKVWATNQDIDQNQLNVEVNIWINGAIVKIIVNLNLQEMKIEMV